VRGDFSNITEIKSTPLASIILLSELIDGSRFIATDHRHSYDETLSQNFLEELKVVSQHP